MATYRFMTDGSHLFANKKAGRFEPSTGFGWVLMKEGKSGFANRRFFKRIDSELTNNAAEWLAVIDAVEYAQTHLRDATKVEILTDSELVVKQINGEYKVKDEKLKGYKTKLSFMDKGHGGYTFDLVVKHIYREKNIIADSLSKLGSLIRFE